MTAEEPDHQNTGTVLQDSYQPIVVALILKTTRLRFRMLARGCEAFTSSGLFQIARCAIASHTSYCDCAALIPLSPGMNRKIAFDGIGADDDHRPEPSHNISICGRSARWDRRPGPGAQPPSPQCGRGRVSRPSFIGR